MLNKHSFRHLIRRHLFYLLWMGLFGLPGLVPAAHALATSTTAVTSNHNPSSPGQGVTFTAVVQGTAGLAPTGSVTFRIDGNLLPNSGGSSTNPATPGSPDAVAGSTTYTYLATALPAGPHTITATYNGDTAYSTSSGTVSQVVKAATTTALTPATQTSNFGQSVTVTATVTGNQPTGTVTFSEGAAVVGTGSVNGSSVAVLTTSSLAVGPHTITAIYNGDSFNAPSPTSGSVTVTVSQAATSVSVASPSPNPSTFGQTVTVTATVNVTAGAGTPTGSVRFAYTSTTGAKAVDVTLNSSRQAQISLSDLPVGANQTISVTYLGDADFAASVPAATTQTVGPETTTTSILSSINPSASGQSVTFTVTVTGGNGVTPAGQATLTYTNAGGTNTTTPAANLNGNGQAQISVANLPVGAGQTLTGNYVPGNGDFASSSGTITQSVTAAATATLVSSSNNPSAVGQSVTFTAVVSTQAPGAGAPTGSVTFTISKSGTTPITLTGTRTAGANSASYAVGQTFTTGGVYTVTAAYAPDTGSFGGSSGSLSPSQQVTATATTVTVAASPTPSRFGQPITLTARVLGQNGITPTGSIQFSSGGVTLGSQSLAVDPSDSTGNTAAASLPNVLLPAGSPQVTASYGGDGTYAPGSSTIVVTVMQSDTAVTVGSSSPTSTFGDSVTLTATVTDATPGSTGTPTGSVTFTDTSTGATLGTGTLLANGTTQVATGTLSAGPHTISAAYSGDTDFAPSAGSVSQTVNPAGTSTTVAASPTAPGLNQPVTFTATVTNTSGNSAIPSGTVSFSEGSTVLGTGSLSGNSGTATATFSTSFATAGDHTVSAVYNPAAGNFAPSGGTVLVTVGRSGGASGTPVTLSSNAPNNTSTFGQPVTFTGTVSGSGGVTPTGTVTFTDAAGGVIGASSLSGGQAVFTTSSTTLAAGTHSIVATYGGDANFTTGTSSALTQVVNAAATTTVVVGSVATATVGDTITFTATLTNSNSTGVTPTGTATFFDSLNSGTPVALGSPVPVTVNGADNSLNSATASLPTTALAQGSHTITATFTPAGGDFVGSSSTTPVGVTVFDKSAFPQNPDQTFLLVPGTIKYTADGLTTAQLLKSTDDQRIGIPIQNLVPGQTPAVLFNGVALPAGDVTVDQNSTHLTIQVPASFTAAAGIASIQVVNPNQDRNSAFSTSIPVNPVMALPAYPVSSARAVRMFSLPYDYTGVSPYDVVEAPSLSPLGNTLISVAPVAGGGGFQYDPVGELLTSITRFTQQATDSAYLALYHWDPNQLRYLTTAPITGQADSVPFVLGQAFWAVGGTDAQFLGVTRVGTPAGFNPTGIPLQKGWNMIGDPFPTPIALSSMQVSYQGVSLPLYSSPSTPTSAVSQGIVSPIFWSYEQAADGTTGYQINDSSLSGRSAMKPYEGYWFYSYQACTLLINNTPPTQ